MNKIFFISMFLIFASLTASAQDDVQIGSNTDKLRQTQSGLFDYSDPGSINIRLQLWGYVKYPGYYIIPANSTLNDLISLAGGPLEDAMMHDIRIFRNDDEGKQQMTKYNINDLLWYDSLRTKISFPELMAGDLVLVPSEPRYFLREDIAFYLSVTTALASIAALIISITN